LKRRVKTSTSGNSSLNKRLNSQWAQQRQRPRLGLTTSGPLLSSPTGEGETVEGPRPKKAKTCGGLPSTATLAAGHPGIEGFWDLLLNKGPLPNSLTIRSRERVWLQCHGCPNCSQAHSWNPRVNSLAPGAIECPRCKLDACPCNSVASMPHLLLEWHEDNQVLPHMMAKTSGDKFAWKCQAAGCDWEWLATANDRSRPGRGAGRRRGLRIRRAEP